MDSNGNIINYNRIKHENNNGIKILSALNQERAGLKMTFIFDMMWLSYKNNIISATCSLVAPGKITKDDLLTIFNKEAVPTCLQFQNSLVFQDQY
jgi:hypothetical protein